MSSEADADPLDTLHEQEQATVVITLTSECYSQHWRLVDNRTRRLTDNIHHLLRLGDERKWPLRSISIQPNSATTFARFHGDDKIIKKVSNATDDNDYDLSANVA